MTDNKQIAHRDESSIGAVSIPMDQQMRMMNEALINPNVDPAKAREMFALMREMQNDARQAEFNRDKGRAIRAMPAIFKKGRNTHTDTRYAKFEDMHRAVMPVLTAHNLTLDFRIGSEGRDITVQPILRHDNGFVEEGGVMKGPADEGKGRSAIQAVGSASSYLKRYSMRAMLNIIEDGEDDDGALGRDNYQMNDRQEGLIVDAQAAADRGEYPGWFGKLSVKDKAVLIQTGMHATLGGGRLLPGSERPSAREPEPAAQQAQERPKPAERQPETKPSGNHDVSTPGGWTAQYVDDCEAAADMDALNRVATKGAGGLKKLSDGHPKLWEQCDFAMLEARDRLKGDG